MTDVYVIRNQHGHYWGKSKTWVSGAEPKTVLQAKHEDEAINTLFELSSKDIELRGEVAATTLSERGLPVVEPSQVPLPTPEVETAVELEEPGTETAVETNPTPPAE
ncbi:hypothetical protein [Halioglobus maricola]|uniref:hypothetical protein n=1 Tax=Halioglobus maricola TaxID=2601894 RepID=UPI00197A8A33|nr:hypothetical protein [Halioglobus maricola]